MQVAVRSATSLFRARRIHSRSAANRANPFLPGSVSVLEFAGPVGDIFKPFDALGDQFL